MLTYDLDRRGTIPRYDYLCRCIRDDILCGRLTAGSRLPSRRSLAEHLKVSAVTVESAYAQLAAEGYIVSREKSGYSHGTLQSQTAHSTFCKIPCPLHFRLVQVTET